MIAVHRHTGVEAGSARIASHAGTGIAVFGIWIAVALVSSFAPRYVSGPDPSEIPIGSDPLTDGRDGGDRIPRVVHRRRSS
jgi:hypothetical protein